jgi:hypothetical protein
MRNQSKGLGWLLVSLCCMFLSVGCISIRRADPNGFQTQTCSDSSTPTCEEPCPLHDRREVLASLATRMNPAQLVPHRVSSLACTCRDRSTAFVSHQGHRVGAMGASVRGWIQEKKDEANAPPWPRFHPLPTRPVFAPESEAESTTPNAYGRFGKG